jgi:uncharacterized protein YbbK (DUF523 family)
MPQLLQSKPKIGVSACLMGQKVRFDGGHKRDSFRTEIFGKFVEWIAVCPEAEIGMGIPRESVRLVGSPNHLKMISEISGRDWTVEMEKFSAERLSRLTRQQLSGYVFKRSSPSCGMERVKIYDESKQHPESVVDYLPAPLWKACRCLQLRKKAALTILDCGEILSSGFLLIDAAGRSVGTSIDRRFDPLSHQAQIPFARPQRATLPTNRPYRRRREANITGTSLRRLRPRLGNPRHGKNS